jgi:hypothetical protein
MMKSIWLEAGDSMEEYYLDKMIEKEKTKARNKALVYRPLQGAASGFVVGLATGGAYDMAINNGKLKIPGNAGKLAAIASATGFSVSLIKAILDRTPSEDSEILVIRSYNRLREILKRKPTEREFASYYNKRVREIDQANSNKRHEAAKSAIKMGTSAAGLVASGLAIKSHLKNIRESKGGNQMYNSPTQRDFMSNRTFEDSLRESPQIPQDHLYGWWEGNRLSEAEQNRLVESSFNYIMRFAEGDFIDGLGDLDPGDLGSGKIKDYLTEAFDNLINAAKAAVASGKAGWEKLVLKAKQAFEALSSAMKSKFSKSKSVDPDDAFFNQAKAAPSKEVLEFRARRAAEARALKIKEMKAKLEGLFAFVKEKVAKNKGLLAAGAGALALGAAGGYAMSNRQSESRFLY